MKVAALGALSALIAFPAQAGQRNLKIMFRHFGTMTAAARLLTWPRLYRARHKACAGVACIAPSMPMATP